MVVTAVPLAGIREDVPNNTAPKYITDVDVPVAETTYPSCEDAPEVPYSPKIFPAADVVFDKDNFEELIVNKVGIDTDAIDAAVVPTVHEPRTNKLSPSTL